LATEHPSKPLLPAVVGTSAPPNPASGEGPVTLICRRRGWQSLNLPELWRSRELLYYLVWRDVKVRYKQAVLGGAWALLQPLAVMIAFSLFFGRMGPGADTGAPYPLFVLAGLLPWTFFANAVSLSAQSVVSNQSLISKVYFPRLLIPIGAVGPGLVDLGISCLLLLGFMLYHRVVPGWGLLLLPVLVLALIAAALGVGVLLAALTVAYRDFRHVVPFLVQLWMFATPSLYMRTDAISPTWQSLLPLNPAYGLVAGFRAAALGSPFEIDPVTLVISAASGLVLLLAGCLYFRRVERDFADVI
jgi:lipopolysaccharide transport system permease protein